MELSSPAFDANLPVPAAYTHKGAGLSPPLLIQGAPPGTQSFALVMHDPDAPHGDFLHWTMWNIPAGATALPENEVPPGAAQGANDFGRTGYGPPAPPSGTHRYVFELYALDGRLALTAGASLKALRAAMENHILARALLTGTVSA